MLVQRNLIGRFTPCLAVWATAWLGMASSGEAQSDGLLKYFPSSANALSIIDVESLLATEMAATEAWNDPTNAKHAERPLQLPQLAKRIAVAAQLNAADDLSRVWELAVMDLAEPVPMRSIALREGGYVDDLSGVPAVWTPSDTYFLALGEGMLGAMYPANRQFVARWAQQAQSNQLLKLNDYLLQSAARIQPGTQIVMALELQNAVRPHAIRDALGELEALAGKEDQIDQVAKLMLGLKGISLTVQVDEAAQGTIRVDFSSDVTPLGRLAKPLLLEALKRFDAVIPDLEEWDAELLGETLVFSGPLTTSGLRRLGSILEPPSTKFSDLQESAPVESGSDDFVKASQAYFKSVDALIQDLSKTLKSTKDNHAVWMERYGRKIDTLPILNVDPELLNWGASVSDTFREMSVSTKTANVRSGVRKSYATAGYGYSGYGYGDNGWYYNDATATEKAKGRVERSEKGASQIERFGSWKEVEDSAASVRIAMTQKYNVEF